MAEYIKLGYRRVHIKKREGGEKGERKKRKSVLMYGSQFCDCKEIRSVMVNVVGHTVKVYIT